MDTIKLSQLIEHLLKLRRDCESDPDVMLEDAGDGFRHPIDLEQFKLADGKIVIKIH